MVEVRPLALLVLSTCLLLAEAAPCQQLPAPVANLCTPSADWGKADQAAAQEVVNLVNERRLSAGQRTLSVDPALTAAATWKALHMARLGYLDHYDPPPPIARSYSTRLRECGYAGGSFGENIGEGYRSPEKTVGGWMNSPEHRRNIESPRYTDVGAGVAQSAEGKWYWSLDLGPRHY